jgi:hypothetical protein
MLLYTNAVNKMSLRLMPCENFPVLIIGARNMGVVGLFLLILFSFYGSVEWFVSLPSKLNRSIYIYICVCVCVCERERERERELVFVREWDHQLCFLSQALPILRKLDMTITSKRSVSWVHFA